MKNNIAQALKVVSIILFSVGGLLALLALVETQSTTETIMGYEFTNDEWSIVALYNALSILVTYYIPALGFLAISEIIELLTEIKMKYYGEDIIKDESQNTAIQENIEAEKQAEEIVKQVEDARK